MLIIFFLRYLGVRIRLLFFFSSCRFNEAYYEDYDVGGGHSCLMDRFIADINCSAESYVVGELLLIAISSTLSISDW